MFSFSRSLSPVHEAVLAASRADEVAMVGQLMTRLNISAEEEVQARRMTETLVREVYENRARVRCMDAVLEAFALTPVEGVALMCLAEALMRMPSLEARVRVVREMLAGRPWRVCLGNPQALFVNAAAWGLLVTGRLASPPSEAELALALTRLVVRCGEEVTLQGVTLVEQVLARQLVVGETIDEALNNTRGRGMLFAFDMLGETAITEFDARHYMDEYVRTLHVVGRHAGMRGPRESNSVSVKLSALHPRYEWRQWGRVMRELLPRVRELVRVAKQYNIGICLEAEEAERHALSLALLAAVAEDAEFRDFNGLGFVVQSNQKNALAVTDFLVDLARRTERRLMVRLVKGAYWANEIKAAQSRGLDTYPVFTRKAHTDLSYFACARALLNAPDAVYPQFATHNANTLAMVHVLSAGRPYEFQSLHGLGEMLYSQILNHEMLPEQRCRIYAPVGPSQALLGYLVRRLLENGSNNAFVSQLVDEGTPLETLLESPLEQCRRDGGLPHPCLPLPRDLYRPARANAPGLDVADGPQLDELEQAMNAAAAEARTAHPLIAWPHAASAGQPAKPVHNPGCHDDIVGYVREATDAEIRAALDAAAAAQTTWAQVPALERAYMLELLAERFTRHRAELIMLAIRESGRTLSEAAAEVRAASDFCLYYAQQARQTLTAAHRPCGTFIIGSPWSSPLAALIGQTTAALAAGNTVILKPSWLTPLIAHRAVQLMHEAGFAKDVVQCLPGSPETGFSLVADPRIAGVLYSGIPQIAQRIHETLSRRSDLPVFVAESHSLNAMIVDDTVLPEHVVTDVLHSAFDCAGQRTTTLRILCLQENIAEKTLAMLRAAISELTIGDPRQLTTDIGPVIGEHVLQDMQAHIEALRPYAISIRQTPLPESLTKQGHYAAPTLIELPNLNGLKREVPGPVLHIIRYHANDLDALIDDLNAKGSALAHGIHSRIRTTIDHLSERLCSGNVFINRSILDGTAGVQPCGGCGLSGTGPKMGGPFYLQQLTHVPYWRVPMLSRHGQPDPRLQTVARLLPAMGFTPDETIRLTSHLARARVVTLRQAECTLPGSIGERNTLTWCTTDTVWLYGGTLACATAALIHLAAAGAQTLIDERHPLAAWTEHLDGLLLPVSDPPMHPFDQVIGLEPLPPALKLRLARRSGAIVRIVESTQEYFDPARIFFEIIHSTNTTVITGM